MADQVQQGAEGDAGRDVEPSIVQHTDLIMFHCVSGPRVPVPDRQGVAACGERENSSYHVIRGYFDADAKQKCYLLELKYL